MTTKTESKTAQAKRMREEKAAKKEAEALTPEQFTKEEEKPKTRTTFPLSEEAEKSLEIVKNSVLTDAQRREVTRLVAAQKINAEQHNKIHMGELTIKEAIEQGKPKPQGKVKNKVSKKAALENIKYGEAKVGTAEVVYIKAWTWMAPANRKGVDGKVAWAVAAGPDGGGMNGVKTMEVRLDEVKFIRESDLDSIEKEVVKEVEKEVVKEVARVPEDSTIRQEIEAQYKQTIVDTTNADVDTQPYIRVQNSLKQLSERLELGIDFNELDNYIPPKKKGGKK